MSVVVRVINLDRSPERLATFTADNPHIAIERFSAIEGKRLDRDACIRQGFIRPENRYNASALGLAASHVLLWQACAAGSEPFNIAEDDVIFHPQFPAAAERVNALANWDVIFWTFNFDWPIQVVLHRSIGPTVMVFEQDIMVRQIDDWRRASFQPMITRLLSCAGTAAYSISPQGARRYLEHCLPIGREEPPDVLKRRKTWENHGLDTEMSRHHGNLAAYVSMPPLALTPNDHTRSTIRSDVMT
jgi:glycosyl transferase, family 25